MRTIHGQIKDSQTGQPIEGVNISLGFWYDGAFGPYPEGTVTNENGEYIFTYTPSGGADERLQLSHIGYTTKVLEPNQLGTDSPQALSLSPTDYDISEVTISAPPAKKAGTPILLIIAVAVAVFLLMKSE
ncbi:MAG: carboxypeptidase-like regulatory domain-containing protein [Gammaproteobacteria bacterium]|nr:carboxypeptidase-like regulatory domain-containing protein [Gammaproteobacteria bacterium]